MPAGGLSERGFSPGPWPRLRSEGRVVVVPRCEAGRLAGAGRPPRGRWRRYGRPFPSVAPSCPELGPVAPRVRWGPLAGERRCPATCWCPAMPPRSERTAHRFAPVGRPEGTHQCGERPPATVPHSNVVSNLISPRTPRRGEGRLRVGRGALGEAGARAAAREGSTIHRALVGRRPALEVRGRCRRADGAATGGSPS